MPFGTVSTLYFPVAGSAGSSMWGTDVRKLNTSADAGVDTTSQVQYGTNTALQTRTVDPYSTVTADLDQTLYGWAVAPADMGSTADFIRYYPAGNHVLTGRVTQTSLSAADITVNLYIYRVGPSPTRTRTLLGNGSATVNAGALSTPVTVTVTVALGSVTFAADETIQYSVECQSTGVAITGKNGEFRTGTDSGVAIRMDTPPLKTISATVGTAADPVGSASGVLSARASMAGTASGTSTASGVPTGITGFAGSAAGTSAAAGVLGGRAGMTGSAGGSSTASAVFAGFAGLVGSAPSVGSAAGFLTALASLVGSAVGTSTASGVPSSVAGTVGDAEGFSDAEGVTGAVVGTVGTVDIGGGCPVDWPFNDGLRSIAGTVLFHEPPNEGDPVSGATVVLVRDSDGFRVATTTTDAFGLYDFPRDTTDPYTYRVEVMWEDAGVKQQGLSEGQCVPA